jgi:hypothetical protein
MDAYFLRFLAFSIALLATAAGHAGGSPDPGDDPALTLRDILAAACAETAPAPRGLGWRLGDAVLVAETEGTIRGGPVHLSRVFRLPGGDELRMVLIHPGGRLRRVSVDYYEATPGGLSRPLMTASAGGDCRILQGRRIVYGRDGRADLELLGHDLKTVEYSEPYDAPVPPGRDPGGVTVAHIDSGINYTIPALAARLARDARGRALGYDFWDLDKRPFDGDTGRSPFFPLHHGTRTASILVREAPGVRLLPYRYPRPDMARMADLVADAEAKGARIVALAMGSNAAAEWRAFAEAAGARPHMLFVVSAGNNGRDIDAEPVYPAALGLDNGIVVTSSDATGHLARGSNWGRRNVDVMTPGENQEVIDHRGRQAKASGSSFAVPRIAALAARLLAANPDWKAAELKRTILARARPSPYHLEPVVRAGWVPYPEEDE